MLAPEDTGQIRKIAEENLEARARPTDVGAAVVTAALALAVALWAFPAFDTAQFDIDATRWAMVAAEVGAAIAAIVCGVYVMDRRNRKRHDEFMAHIDSLRTLACHNRVAVGQLAAQVEQLDAKVGTYWNGYTAGVTDVQGGKANGKVLPFDR